MIRNLLAACCLLGLALPAGLLADEKPSKALKRVIKTTAKAGNYELETQIRGGLAQGEDHQINSLVVSASYTTEHFKNLVHFSAPFEGFQMAGANGGASLQEGQWKTLNGCDEGRKANKLFKSLEEVLVDIKKLSKTAEWVDAELAGPQQQHLESGTVSDAELPVLRHLRVYGPTKMAVEKFSEIQQSGCFGAG